MKEMERVLEKGKEETKQILEEGGRIIKTIIEEKDKITTITKIEPVEGESTSSEVIQNKGKIIINY